MPLEVIDVPVPDDLEPHGLLVEIDVATMCGSDVHIWKAEVEEGVAVGAPTLPAILGHEMVGRIIEFSDESSRVDSLGVPLELGDRIVWTHGTCGKCFYCNVAREPSLCANRHLYMWAGCADYPYLTGGFAEYGYVFPDAGRIRVPDGVTDEAASASSCALRTVLQGFQRLGAIEAWETVVIQGAGPLGLFATAVADHVGAGQVVVVGGPAERLEVAAHWGATTTIDIDSVPDPEDRQDQVFELTNGLGADIVMEFSGGKTAFSEGLEMVRRDGRYLIVGQVLAEYVPVRTALITMKQARIIGSWSGSTGQYWRALQFVARTSHKYDYGLMTSTQYGLDEVNLAFERMSSYADIKPALYPGRHKSTA